MSGGHTERAAGVSSSEPDGSELPKVGDTVTFTGVVTEVDPEKTSTGRTLMLIRWPDGFEDWLFDSSLADRPTAEGKPLDAVPGTKNK